MSKRKAKSSAAKKAAKGNAPTTPPAAQAAAGEAVAKKHVEIDGATTTRHYGDGTYNTTKHVSEAEAKAYANDCGVPVRVKKAEK